MLRADTGRYPCESFTLNEQFLGWKTVSPDLVVLQNIVFEVFHVPTASAAQLQLYTLPFFALIASYSNFQKGPPWTQNPCAPFSSFPFSLSLTLLFPLYLLLQGLRSLYHWLMPWVCGPLCLCSCYKRTRIRCVPYFLSPSYPPRIFHNYMKWRTDSIPLISAPIPKIWGSSSGRYRLACFCGHWPATFFNSDQYGSFDMGWKVYRSNVKFREADKFYSSKQIQRLVQRLVIPWFGERDYLSFILPSRALAFRLDFFLAQ